ncbi:hypothetical protein SAMN02910297_00184 [Methanobrevibacter olleyae]|uniref:Uncharacterized protein n=1 Tax=Methanobrevibacter olleyae TaxID=294671 RepID=A0A1I4FSY6_METOL|nr:hypothetical protein [Methanobrevibacter olleyae]SFL19801.1 hypothetical protein SAMN02910297_00184 [Methanobrevibacter olleyae]
MTETQNINEKDTDKNQEEINSLKEEISYLKEILVSKIFEEDHLINFTCKEIETDYSLKFGVYKYKIKDYKIKIKKTKRTIELIKKMINKQSTNQFNKDIGDLEENQIKINKTKINRPKINMVEIENHIANEFKEEDLELETETAKVNILIEKHKNSLNKNQDFKELNTCYKDCIRKIHPDLLLKPTSFEENLFYNSKEAYEDRDLVELESTRNLINMHKIDKIPKTLEEFEELRDKIEINIELEEKEISKIINSKPHTQLKFLLDTKKVNDYKEGLVTSLLEVEKEFIKVNKKLIELKKENNITYKLDLTKENG